MTEPTHDYGSGLCGVVLVEQKGPATPPQEAVDVAYAILAGKLDVPPPCLDCAPNLILSDYICNNCGEWEWGLVVAHDDTCPAHNGLIGA